jgi:hypothetical protein
MLRREDRAMVSSGTQRAAAERDLGVQRIASYTWRIGAVAATIAAVIMFAFGRHPGEQTVHGILIPGQPPAAAHGSGQVTSGAS